MTFGRIILPAGAVVVTGALAAAASLSENVSSPVVIASMIGALAIVLTNIRSMWEHRQNRMASLAAKQAALETKGIVEHSATTIQEIKIDVNSRMTAALDKIERRDVQIDELKTHVSQLQQLVGEARELTPERRREGQVKDPGSSRTPPWQMLRIYWGAIWFVAIVFELLKS